MPKICVFTACRSEYGLLRWVAQELLEHPLCELQWMVSGNHFSIQFGETWKQIQADGFEIHSKIEMHLDSSSKASVAKSNALLSLQLASELERLEPDCVVCLGDRSELLSLASCCLVLGIPLAHIAGGDVTQGAIDDSVRHATSKLASLHFPGTQSSAQRIAQMGEESWRIHCVGETNIDQFLRLPSLSKEELAQQLALNPEKSWALFTYHPETQIPIDQDLQRIRICLEYLAQQSMEIIASYPNSDAGSQQIIELLHSMAQKYPQIKIVPSLGQLRYANLLRFICGIYGNSSSGIFESQMYCTPTVNIGDRQKGRLITPNILCTSGDASAIKCAIDQSLSPDFVQSLKGLSNPYGDGQASQRIVQQIVFALQNYTKGQLLQKVFHDA